MIHIENNAIKKICNIIQLPWKNRTGTSWLSQRHNWILSLIREDGK
jgi:hypothetical protein